MNPRPPYHRAAIQKWYADIELLPKEIAELNANINSIHHEQEKIANTIHKIKQHEIEPRHVEIRKIEARMRVLQLPNQIATSHATIEKLTAKKAAEERHLAELEGEANRLGQDIVTLQQMADFYHLKAAAEALSKKIQKAEELKSFHSKNGDRHKKNIEYIESQLEIIKASLLSLENRKRQSASFQDFHETESSPALEATLITSLTFQQTLLENNKTDLAKETKQFEETQAAIQRLDNLLSQKKETLALTQSKIAGHLAHSQPIIATPDELQDRLTKNQLALRANLAEQKISQEKIQNDEREIIIQSMQISDVEKSYELAKDYRKENSIKTLEDNQADVQKVLEQISLRITNYEEINKQLNEKISLVNSAIEEKKILLQALLANEFLRNFQKNPRALFTSLTNLLREKLAAFDARHPDTQTEEERLSLLDINAKLALFEFEEQNGVAHWQEHLQQLLGFLHCMETRLIENVPLKNYLKEIINTLPLDLNEAFDAYNELIQSSPVYNLKTVADLHRSEQQAYEAACERLSKTLNALPLEKHPCYQQLKDKGMAVLTVIQESKAKEGNKFNYKFNTVLLNVTGDLALKPNDLATRKQFVALTAKVTAGKASFTKKLTGALVFFLGTALLVASITAKVCSLGLASPITFLGMGIGVKLMIGGIGLFASGMERGMTHALTNVAKASERVNNLSDPISEHTVPKLKME